LLPKTPKPHAVFKFQSLIFFLMKKHALFIVAVLPFLLAFSLLFNMPLVFLAKVQVGLLLGKEHLLLHELPELDVLIDEELGGEVVLLISLVGVVKGESRAEEEAVIEEEQEIEVLKVRHEEAEDGEKVPKHPKGHTA